MAREWIIFAICLGLGGHIALAVVLHAPDLWPWSKAWLYGILSGFTLYVAVQVVRSIWWIFRGKTSDEREARVDSTIGHS
jgi:hypothetical protein